MSDPVTRGAWSDRIVLVNPRSGSGRGQRVWEALLEAHPEVRTATLVQEGRPEMALERLAEALETATRGLMVVGGDGTLHYAVNALLEAGAGSRVPLGLVPAGTGSDVARTLGLPSEPEAALDVVLGGRNRSIDAILVEAEGLGRRWVINVASAGISGVVAEAINALPSRGPLSYAKGALGPILRYRPTPMRVEVDGETWHDGPALLAAVANGRSFGKAMMVAPEAEMDDGLADVVVVGEIPRWQLLFRFGQLYLGRHLGIPAVRWGRGRRVVIEPRGPSVPPHELDGETVAGEAATFRVSAGALEIAVPA